MTRALGFGIKVILVCAAIRLWQLDETFAMLIIGIVTTLSVLRLLSAWTEYKHRKEDHDD